MDRLTFLTYHSPYLSPLLLALAWLEEPHLLKDAPEDAVFYIRSEIDQFTYKPLVEIGPTERELIRVRLRPRMPPLDGRALLAHNLLLGRNIDVPINGVIPSQASREANMELYESLGGSKLCS